MEYHTLHVTLLPPKEFRSIESINRKLPLRKALLFHVLLDVYFSPFIVP